jgi:hypothetical protein
VLVLMNIVFSLLEVKGDNDRGVFGQQWV